jgi:4-amino-4-deoxy-L-arabinose transferase-like glycosyltransferase
VIIDRFVSDAARPGRDLAWLLGVALLVIGAGIGLRDPWPTDEPRFALLSKYILDSGEWLFLRRGEELYSDKPPVFMWLQATAIALAGSVRAGFLLPSLLASLGTLALVYDLGRRLWTHRVGLVAAWLLLFALQFTFQAKRAQIDPTLLFLMTLANYGLLRHLLRGPDWRMWCLGWFAAGLGTVTKGAGMLSLLLLLPAAFALAKGWRGIGLGPWRWLWLGPAAFLLATLVWLGPLLWAVATHDDPALREYLHTVLYHQTVNRYTSSWDHHEPFWYQFGVVATLWLPASLALPWAIPAWWRRIRRGDPRYLLVLGWVAMVVLFFSVPAGKRDVYIMPALPMFCLALAPLVPGLARRAGPQRLVTAFVLALGTSLLLAGLMVLLGDTGFERRLLAERGTGAGDIALLAWLVLAMGGWSLACAAWHRGRRSLLAAAFALGGVWLMYSLAVYPILDRHSSSRTMMSIVTRTIGPDAELAAVAWREQQLLLADRPVRTFGFGPQARGGAPWPAQWAAAADWLARGAGERWVISRDDALPDCVDRSRVVDLGVSNRRDWSLVPAGALPAGCPEGGVGRHAAPAPSR